MLIDWVTVAAQIFNFLLLVLLLSRFLFKPVLSIVAERDQSIKTQLNEAAQHEAEVRQEKKRLFEERETFKNEKEAMLSTAVAEARHEKEQLISNAKQEYETLHRTLTDRLGQDEMRLYSDARSRIGHTVFGFARKVLRDLSGVELEEQIIKVFLSRVRTMDATPFISDLTHSNGMSICGGFELSQPVRDSLEKALSEKFGRPLHCVYTKDPSVLCGIALVTSGHRIDWNLSEYLTSAEASI